MPSLDPSFQRSDVAWIRHRYRQFNRGSFVLEWGSHPALCLLPKDFASALGAQVVVVGTRHGAEAARLGAIQRRPLECVVSWRNVKKGTEEEAGWKINQLMIVDELDRSSWSGTINAGWEDALRSGFDQILGRDHDVEAKLRNLPGRAPGRHPAVRSLQEGSVVRYEGRDVLVLSCDPIHRLHRYACVLVAPLIGGSSVATKAAAISVEGARIAYEYAQTIEPVAIESFEVVAPPSAAAASTLAVVRNNLRSYWAGSNPPGVAATAFIEYLREASSEYRARGMRLQVGDLDVPCGYGNFVRTSRGLPHAGRAATGGLFGVIGGADKFRLPYESKLFDIWIIRRNDKLFVEVTTRQSGDALEEVWISTEDEPIAAQISGDQIPSDGIVKLPLGKIDPTYARPTTRLIGLCSRWGLEEVPVEIVWNPATPQGGRGSRSAVS